MAKTPRFSGRQASSALASRIKQRNRAINTAPELALRRALWKLGLRYRLDAKGLPGRPDIVFRRARVVVFCDGDFWHGRNWRVRRRRLAIGSNAPYWIAKISTNRSRDRRVNTKLRQDGWLVIRLWETDILKNAEEAAGKIKKAVVERLRAVSMEIG